ASRRSTTSPTTMTAGGVIRASRASAAMFSRVEVTVRWSVVVPTRVIDNGEAAARAAAIRDSEVSAIWPAAEGSPGLRAAAYWRQSIFASPQVTTATSRWVLVVSGMPAYAGTAVTAETPGTISKASPALAHAWASSGPEA